MPSYEAHVEWLASVNARYEQTISTLTSPSSVAPAAATGLPHAPAAWVSIHTEEAAVDISQQFDSIALDGADFDEPVYRSLSDAFDSFSSGSSSWAASEAEFDEPPVYRSLSDAMVSAAQDPEPAAAAGAALSAEEAERLWLAGENPPLIRRQHARGATFAL